MTSSPACWEAFGKVLEREYSTPELMEIHRLSVDAWAVQHPGDGSRRATQSVGLHLARLALQLERGLGGEAANAAMLRLAERKSELQPLPPRSKYRMTVADVVDAVEPAEHRRLVTAWAEATWADWADEHGSIRDWVQRVVGR